MKLTKQQKAAARVERKEALAFKRANPYQSDRWQRQMLVKGPRGNAVGFLRSNLRTDNYKPVCGGDFGGMTKRARNKIVAKIREELNPGMF